MNDKAIGIFDSGLGGLTTVKEMAKILPGEDIIYFGDTLRVPYGNRSRETIIKYAMDDVKFLLKQDVKMIIAACGTVSSVATGLGLDIKIPFTGVVEPTAMAAYLSTKNKRIGVIGTTATIKTNSYKKEIKRLDPEIEVIEKDCPLFVPLVENGFIGNDTITTLVAEKYLLPIKNSNVDTLILGCTHYPIIQPIIERIMGRGVAIIDSGKATAKFAAKKLKELNLLNKKGKKGIHSFFVSDSIESFSKTADIFLGEESRCFVKKVDI
ncbi:MAG: glutamate racemase [Clostridia bacterium]|nr:glutamate racemase [Clostridia bacterium]